MGNYKKTLLIGCGGSGITTLIRLNELLSSNPKFRDDVRENISYLVVDTNKKALNSFESTIKSQMGEAGQPYVATAHITNGYNNLNQIVRPNFDTSSGDSENLEKLKEHWMFSPDGEPFRGIQIKNLEGGAGQCCQISYLATWNYMQKLEQKLGTVVNEIRRRNTNPDPNSDLAQLQVILVAGFAGGTGRGSWHLIAFKVRQYLQEQGFKDPDITGVFFDSSCYPNVISSARREEKENLFVNSYTAMSELSAWLRCKSDDDNYYYELPYLDHPSSYVIKVEDDGNPSNQSPVVRAYLIFGSNGRTGELLHNLQYHNMAATALYTMVVYPDAVNEISSNRRMNIGSFGATTFEVDTYHLHSFFETAVQKKFIETQCTELTKGSLSDEVDEFVHGKVSGNINPGINAPAKGKYLSNNCLWLPESLSANSGAVSLESIDQDEVLSLLQKVFKDKIANKLNKIPVIKEGKETGKKEFGKTQVLRKKFGIKNVSDKDVKTTIDSLLKVSDFKQDEWTQMLDEVLSEFKLNHDNLITTLNNTVLEQFAPKDKEGVSLSRCILFTKKLIECLNNYKHVLEQGISVQGSQGYCTDMKAVTTNLNDLVDKAYKEDNGFLGMGRKFNDKEIESICARFQFCFYAAIFFKLQPVLIEFYERAMKHLNKIADSLNYMVMILKKTNELLDQNFKSDFSKLSYDEIIKEYFVNADDPDSVLESIPVASSLKNVYYRQLKPIMSINQINELLMDSHNVRIDRNRVMEEIGKQLQALFDINDSTKEGEGFESFDDALKALPKKLCETITANVHLKDEVENNKTFMEKNFSFEEVLKKNRTCWNDLLKKSSSTQRANLKDRFRDFLGVSEEDYDEDNCLSLEIIKKKIIHSLVYSCKPWIQFDTDSGPESLDCTILLPFDIDEPETLGKELSEMFMGSLNAQIECPGKMNDNVLNLPIDRIVVFNAEAIENDDFAPLDKVQNLTQWRRDATISALLELTEAPREGEAAWFKYDSQKGKWVEKQRGMAYVSPIFLNNPDLRRLRWHPWLKETSVTVDEIQRAKVHEALFYAFLGNGVEEGTLKTTLAGYDCDRPLSSMKDQDFYPFNYKNPRVYRDGKMIPSIKESSWDKNISSSKALHSIDHVVKYLLGEGDVTYANDPLSLKYKESKPKGMALCEALNKEADAFFTNIFSKLSAEDKKNLLICLYSWLTKQQDASDKTDRQYWDALLVFAEKKCETLGVRIE